LIPAAFSDPLAVVALRFTLLLRPTHQGTFTSKSMFMLGTHEEGADLTVGSFVLWRATQFALFPIGPGEAGLPIPLASGFWLLASGLWLMLSRLCSFVGRAFPLPANNIGGCLM
jgi:hypothetical protein